jgi:hypothetical protein
MQHFFEQNLQGRKEERQPSLAFKVKNHILFHLLFDKEIYAKIRTAIDFVPILIIHFEMNLKYQIAT